MEVVYGVDIKREGGWEPVWISFEPSYDSCESYIKTWSPQYELRLVKITKEVI